MTLQHKITDFLPTTKKELKAFDWDELDVIIFSGDAYVDHPAFGAAVIGRVIQNAGLRVAIVSQPNWRDDLRDFKKLGAPRLFFGVTAGNMDSMINHYTANKRLRSNDAYTVDGKAGQRPDYAVTVYTKILKELYPDTPVVIGGIEASLRRLTHYDYWSDKLKPSVLIESGADLLVYGNGEKSIAEIARLAAKGVPVSNMKNIPQTTYLTGYELNTKKKETKHPALFLHSHEDCLKDKKKFAENFKQIEIQSNQIHAKILKQKTGKFYVNVNPPHPLTSEKELDGFYGLPYTRLPHPKYKNKGNIPAYEMIKFSINMHRGCFGACSFCTISAHQGKFVSSRSEKSILKEVDEITKMPDFRGTISDLGGPSANMYKMQGKDLKICEKCKRPSCIFPDICFNLNTDHSALTEIYKKTRKHPKIKHAFIGSGIRYDMLFNKQGKIVGDKAEYTKELIKYHVSGRLKVAPEHTEDKVLKIMRKPSFDLFYKFKKYFEEINREQKMNQQIIPYFISSHPGSKDSDMAELAGKTKKLDFKLEQVQDLTPTPMTVAAVIYYSGYHPYTLEKVYTARSKEQKLTQRMFFFWYKKEYRQKIKDKLLKMKRKDLVKKLFS
ncbi:MAG: YgiQ family radical SAM protein [Bacteroidales bacterium]|nr:YgiQ family radical SAM protein [Bacteroidales bacterium]